MMYVKIDCTDKRLNVSDYYQNWWDLCSFSSLATTPCDVEAPGWPPSNNTNVFTSSFSSVNSIDGHLGVDYLILFF